MPMDDGLARKLKNIGDSYDDFVAAVLIYTKKKPSRRRVVEDFLDHHPGTSTSDILEYISNQADFFEDAAYPTETG